MLVVSRKQLAQTTQRLDGRKGAGKQGGTEALNGTEDSKEGERKEENTCPRPG